MQVSVLQYGSIITVDVPWQAAQEKSDLMGLVDHMQQERGPSRIGNAGLWAGVQGLRLVLALGMSDD